MRAKTTYIFSSVLSLVLLGHSCVQHPSETPTQLLTHEPSSTPSPLSSNNLLISFIQNASDGMDDISACLNGYDSYRFVLTRDGHLIRFDEGHYAETRISQAEIDKLVSEIEATGFSSLAGDGDQYIQNAPLPSFENTWGGSLTVNEKTITITPGQSDYLVESAIKTLDIIENYRPNDLRLYTPAGIKLWVFLEQDFGLGLANPTPEPPGLKWSIENINLENLLTRPATSDPKIVSGEALSFVMQQLIHVPAVRKVEQNRHTYLVLACPNFS
jgi:hypothetical protein